MLNDMTSDYRGEERDKSEFGGLWVTWAPGEIYPYIIHIIGTAAESGNYM